MNKKNLLALLMIVMWSLSIGGIACAQNDMKTRAECKHCGMDRGAFAYSRMLIEYTDGTTVGTCSIHCAAIDLALNKGKALKAIMVGNYKSKALIEAKKAIWVLGGKKKGVMTRNPTWAFAQKADADAFIAENGGKIVNYETALKAAYKELDADTCKMIRQARKNGKREIE